VSGCFSGSLLALCRVSATDLIDCFRGCSHPSFSALASMQIAVNFLDLSMVSFLSSASGPDAIR